EPREGSVGYTCPARRSALATTVERAARGRMPQAPSRRRLRHPPRLDGSAERRSEDRLGLAVLNLPGPHRRELDSLVVCLREPDSSTRRDETADLGLERSVDRRSREPAVLDRRLERPERN